MLRLQLRRKQDLCCGKRYFFVLIRRIYKKNIHHSEAEAEIVSVGIWPLQQNLFREVELWDEWPQHYNKRRLRPNHLDLRHPDPRAFFINLRALCDWRVTGHLRQRHFSGFMESRRQLANLLAGRRHSDQQHSVERRRLQHLHGKFLQNLRVPVQQAQLRRNHFGRRL